MNNSPQLKKELQHLKKLAKKHPNMFARLASLEMEQGKAKAASKRLKKGLEQFPEMTSAKALYAECLSQLGDHDSSLKQWEEVIYSEPYNARARAGYVRELAFLERDEQLTDAIADLYGIDPLDRTIRERHQEALLRSIRRTDPSIRVWNPQWHPGDFTPAGATARDIAERLHLTKDRDSIPDDVKPFIDESMADRLVAELGILSHEETEEESTEVEFSTEEDSTEGEPVSDEERALASLFDEGEGGETEEAALDDIEVESDSDVALDDELDIQLDESPADMEVEATAEAVTETVDEEAVEEIETAEEELPEEESVVEETATEESDDHAEAAVESAPDVDLEAVLEGTEKEAPEAVNKLSLAVAGAGIDPEGVFDIENLVKNLEDKEPYIVKDPVVKIASVTQQNGPVEVRTGRKATHKADEADKAAAVAREKAIAKAPEEKKEEPPAPSSAKPVTEKPKETPPPAPVKKVEPAPAASAPPKPEPAKEPAGGQMSQDELDALIAANKKVASAPLPEESKPVEEPEPKPSVEEVVEELPEPEIVVEDTAAPEPEIQEEEVAEEVEPDLTMEEIEKAADDILDTRSVDTSNEFVSQADLDDILSGKTKPDLSECESPSSEDDMAMDEGETVMREAEELDGELDQAMLDSIYGEQTEPTPSEPVHEDLPGDEVTQELLDELFVQQDEKPEEPGDGESALSQDDLDRVFNESADLADLEEGMSLNLDKDLLHTVKGTPTLEEMQKRLDELELRAEHGDLRSRDGEDTETGLAGHADLDHILDFRKDDEADEEATTHDVVETPEPAPAVEPTTVKEKVKPPIGGGITAQDFAEAFRTATPAPRIARPQPHRSHAEEPEIPPEEFNGPVTRTFAKLCLAQGKTEHAAYVLGKLLKDNPDDPDLLKLQAQIDEKTG